MTRILLATRNLHKQREFAEMLGADFVLEDLSAYPQIGEVDETGTTFEANARLKALAISSEVPGLVLADDSGLEVDSLGGAPGVYSARYAGPVATDAENRRKLLADLAAAEPGEKRRARFRCVLVLAREKQVLSVVEGRCEGRVLTTERGSGGFGYDPIFVPDGFNQTFAEISAAQKNALSHRARAAVELRAYWHAKRAKQ